MADLQGSVDDANLQNTGGYQLVGDPDANDNGDAGRPSKKRMLADAGDDDDDDEKGGRERRKIDIKFINDKSRRHITFSKRKAGIMKKVCSCARLDVPHCLPITRHSVRLHQCRSMQTS
jgi:pheromone receptor transcription factor